MCAMTESLFIGFDCGYVGEFGEIGTFDVDEKRVERFHPINFAQADDMQARIAAGCCELVVDVCFKDETNHPGRIRVVVDLEILCANLACAIEKKVFDVFHRANKQ